MKQFRVDYRRSSTPRFFGLAAATERYGSEVTKGLDALAVGQSCVDCDGDTWTRLPDVGDEPQSAGQARKERRDRIATATLSTVLAATLASPEVAAEMLRIARENDTTDEALLARDAIRYADALIAALDAAE